VQIETNLFERRLRLVERRPRFNRSSIQELLQVLEVRASGALRLGHRRLRLPAHGGNVGCVGLQELVGHTLQGTGERGLASHDCEIIRPQPLHR
jgi:hypothetical protein